MTHDEFIKEMEGMFKRAVSDGYRRGFVDGMSFVKEPAENLLSDTEKAVDHVLAQVDDLHGRGKEYNLVKQCLDAVIIDIKAAAHLKQPTKLEDFWDGDEEL